jgi:hypothetical protein
MTAGNVLPTPTSNTPLLDAALEYAKHVPVFPVHYPVDGGCSCRRPDCGSVAKHPMTTNGFHNASQDETVIREWWARWPQANIGMGTGAGPGVAVVDLDNAEAERAFESLMPPFDATPVVLTGGGGTHFYFSHPGTPVKTRAAIRGVVGFDVRGDGGFVVLPPSRHQSGERYTWLTEPKPFARWSIELEEIQPTVRSTILPPSRHATSTAGGTAYGLAALEGEVDKVSAALPGTRNDTFNASCFNVGQLVASRDITETFARDVLHGVGLAIGLGRTEVAKTLESGLNAGMRQPRGNGVP